MSSKQKNRIKIQFDNYDELDRYIEAVHKKGIKYRPKFDKNQIIIFFPKHLEKEDVLNTLEKGLVKKNFSYEIKY